MTLSRRSILKALGGACAAVGLGKVIGLPEPVKPRVLGLAEPLVGKRVSTTWYDDPEPVHDWRTVEFIDKNGVCHLMHGSMKDGYTIRREVERG